ncbi:MAG: 4Fe-4S binding protein [Nitrososphaerota archaeon]
MVSVLNMKNVVQWIRHVSQALFFVFFVLFVIGTVCSFTANGFAPIEPLGGLQIIFSNMTTFNTRILLMVLSGIAIFVITTILFGKAWCAWACPVGSVVELVGYAFSKAKLVPYTRRKNRVAPKNSLLNKNIKHAVLGGVLGSAIISRNPAWCSVCPIGTICRGSAAGGLVAVAETVIVGGVVASSLYENRFFCRFLCPVSSLLTIISKLNPFFKPIVKRGSCKECGICDKICPEGIPLYKEKELAECTKCLVCYSKCPQNGVTFKTISRFNASKKMLISAAIVLAFFITVIPISNMYLAPKEVSLTITPANFTIISGGNITFTANLSFGAAAIPNKDIVWWASDGFFDKNDGYVVRYIAPSTHENKTVTIIASFYGDEEYKGATTTIVGTVISLGQEPTTTSIMPQSFVVKPGEYVTLKAVVLPQEVPIELIEWKLEGPGRLSNNVGESVTYFAPQEVEVEVQVRISAFFKGNVRYLPSMGYAVGKVSLEPTTPPPFYELTGECYDLRFSRISFKDGVVEGPINIGNFSFIRIRGAEATVYNMSMFNASLMAAEAMLKGLEIYASSFKGILDGRVVELTGNKKVALSGTIEMNDGEIMFTMLRCKALEAIQLRIVGKYVRGSEPYMPSVVTATEVVLSQKYAMSAPESYEELVKKVMKLTSGQVEADGFSIIMPTEYHLNRALKEYGYKAGLVLNSTKLTGENMTMYAIYYKIIVQTSRYIGPFGSYSIKATGDESIGGVIWHLWTSWGIGRYYCHRVLNVEVHTVLFKLDKASLTDVQLLSSIHK